MTLGERIYKLRSEKGVSQETLAMDLNVSRQAVSKWETDQSIPDLDKIKAISDYFEVTIDSLVKDTKEVDIIKEPINENLDKKYDPNKIKRMVLIMFKTTIALSIFYITYYLILILCQNHIQMIQPMDSIVD